MTSGKHLHRQKEDEGVDGRLLFWLECALYIQVIVLLGHAAAVDPIFGVFFSLGHPVLYWMLSLSHETVPPTDEDVDKILGKGYSEWKRKEEERERRSKRGG